MFLLKIICMYNLPQIYYKQIPFMIYKTVAETLFDIHMYVYFVYILTKMGVCMYIH